MLQVTNKDIKSNMGDHIDIALISFDDDINDISIPDESTAPLCDGIPRRFWVDKYVIPHKADKVTVAKGICHNVSSDIVVGSRGLLEDNHVAVQICSSLSMANVPDDWRYSI